MFVKSPQGYALSAAGDRLLTHGEQVEHAMRAGIEAMQGSSDILTGQIRIGLSDGCAIYLLPQVYARLSPKTRILIFKSWHSPGFSI